MKKKIIASVVVLTLLFGMLPIYSQATDELRNPRIIGSDSWKTVTYKDENGLEYSYVYGDPMCITWDCVYFGSYWQKDSDGNIDKTKEKQPIKWRVLSVDGDDLFLLADDSVYESKYYEDNDTRSIYTWKDSIARNNIQTDFIPNAFTKDEQNDIIETDTTLDDVQTTDKVFLLSEEEGKNKKYGFIKGKSGSTYGETWILRCNITSSYGLSRMESYAYDTMNCSGIGATVFYQNNIRPALHLKKSSTHYKKAGTVNIYDELDVERTPEPAPTSKPTKVPVPTATTTPTPQTPKKVVKKVAAPSKPTKIKVKNNKKKTATVTWSKVSGAKGYRVQYAYSAPFSKKTKTVSTNKFVAKKLKKKKTYSFRVRAYKMNGKKKLYGKWSKVVRIKIKK